MSDDERRTVSVELCELADADDGGSCRITLAELQTRINQHLEGLPKSQRESVYLSLTCHGDYAHAYLELRLDRQETDDEYANRVAQYRRYAEDREREERARYERLKAKYERP